MFYCQATKRLSQPGESAQKLITHVRNKTYLRRNHKTNQDEAIGHGVETVREILVSNEYYQKAMADGFKPAVVK